MLRQLGIIGDKTRVTAGKRTTRRSVRYEVLEARELLSRNLEWIGGVDKNWNSYRVWEEVGGGVVDYFTAGDNAIFIDGASLNKNVSIPGSVQPNSIEVKAPGYTISGGSISCWRDTVANQTHDLTITVDYGDKDDVDPDTGKPIHVRNAYVATISSQIINATVGSNTYPTHLQVSNGAIAGEGTGLLKLNASSAYPNTYTGGTAVAGGKVEAETADSLPHFGSGTALQYYPVAVTSTGSGVNQGTLIVRAGGAGQWANEHIDALLNHRNGTVPTTTFEDGDTVFGIAVDGGKAFEYSGVIPGDPTAATTYDQEDFAKFDVGTLTLSGENTYLGKTDVNMGTLVATAGRFALAC
jgi:autotransporter-associated beta strand protein